MLISLITVSNFGVKIGGGGAAVTFLRLCWGCYGVVRSGHSKGNFVGLLCSLPFLTIAHLEGISCNCFGAQVYTIRLHGWIF